MLVSRHYEKTNFITGLRAIAVMMIFLIHSDEGGLRELGGAYFQLVEYSRYGVEVFFVLSGYTVFFQFYESNCSLQRFILIRASRLSKPYFPILILLYIYINLGG